MGISPHRLTYESLEKCCRNRQTYVDTFFRNGVVLTVNRMPHRKTISKQPPRTLARRTQRFLVIGLCLCFLSASLAFALNQPSFLHHQEHHKHAHSQTWCSWSCQAGQAVSVGFFLLESFVFCASSLRRRGRWQNTGGLHPRFS